MTHPLAGRSMSGGCRRGVEGSNPFARSKFNPEIKCRRGPLKADFIVSDPGVHMVSTAADVDTIRRLAIARLELLLGSEGTPPVE